jgi:3-deoxy-D-manno-octulosonic-acid transferase
MYFLYSVLMVGWGIILIPVFFYKAWRYQKYLPGLRQRLGKLPDSLRSDGRPTIWFHSCSVGETLSVQPLVHVLHQRLPEARFVFSTITNTGQIIARQRFAKYGDGNSFYFPIDLASVANRVLDWIRPVMMVIIDTEIWPNVLHQAYLRGIPVILVNGRVSAASFRYYRWARPVLRRVLRNYRVLMMKSEQDAERIKYMGALPDKIVVTGNLKYDRDLVEKEISEAQARALEESLELNSAAGHLIVAGSTHPGEEQTLLAALARIKKTPGLEQTRLLLAPRHPERFDAVAALAARAGFRVRRRSNGSTSAQDAEVLVLDTLGELATAYRFATVVFVGGTLIRHGGQSIMEPALYAKPIVIGPSMENFPQIIDEFRSRHGVRQISAAEDDKDAQVQQLTEAFVRLLQDPVAREVLGKAAYSVSEGNRGAAQRTVEKIVAIYRESVTR